MSEPAEVVTFTLPPSVISTLPVAVPIVVSPTIFVAVTFATVPRLSESAVPIVVSRSTFAAVTFATLSTTSSPTDLPSFTVTFLPSVTVRVPSSLSTTTSPVAPFTVTSFKPSPITLTEPALLNSYSLSTT